MSLNLFLRPSPAVVLATLNLLAVASVRCAEDDGSTPDLTRVDKSPYHLFRPTPPEYMREMSTDRPDKTESPYTVDAGHFQFEMDVVSYSYDRERVSSGVRQRTESWAVAPLNLKVGLCNWSDFQVMIEPWNEVRSRMKSGGATFARSANRGFGDITARLKCNLWGNDGGPTAFGAMPFVKIPTNQDDLGNDSVEGGIILPFALELPRGFGMGVMSEFDIIRDGDDDGHHPEFINSITFNRDIVGDLGGYIEFFSLVSTEDDSDWVGTLDVGFTYGLTEDIQLDAGVNIGVTKSADDVNPFVGVSWRF